MAMLLEGDRDRDGNGEDRDWDKTEYCRVLSLLVQHLLHHIEYLLSCVVLSVAH
jgi:hypothetical protein